MKGWGYMELLLIAVLIITYLLVNNKKVTRSPIQLMLMGIEITIVGVLFIVLSMNLLDQVRMILFMTGLVAILTGFTTCAIGFNRKQ